MQTRYSIQGSSYTRRSTSRILRALSPLTAVLALACARAEPQALGYTNDSLESSEEDTEVTPRSFFGSWVGVAEDALALADDPGAYRFPSGSTQIRISIGEQVSSIIFGEGEPPPEPIDPNVSYPPGLSVNEYEPNPVPQEGFEYTFFEHTFLSEVAPEHAFPGGYESSPDFSLAPADGIMRMQYSPAQAMAPWCAEQRSQEDGHGGWNCLGAKGISYAMDGACYTFDSEADFYPIGAPEWGVIPDPARLVDCVRSFQCFDQCVCPSYGNTPQPGGTPCFAADVFLGELWLRRTDEGLFGVFAGDAVFENARGARTTLGRVRFVPAAD